MLELGDCVVDRTIFACVYTAIIVPGRSKLKTDKIRSRWLLSDSGSTVDPNPSIADLSQATTQDTNSATLSKARQAHLYQSLSSDRS